MLNRSDYEELANKLNVNYPSLNAKVNVSPFGGRLEIEVSSVDKAKAANEIYHGYNFTSGSYK